MAKIAAFRGIVYDTQKAGPAERLLAPPYDVISEEERTRLAALSPYNCVRLILPEGQGDEKYANAANTLRAWMDAGIMRRDDAPALYRYHQRFTAEGVAATRKGFICRIKLQPFSDRVILPHERTLSGPKADRLKLKRATRAHLSQVFGLYSDPARATDRPFEAIESQPPLFDATTTDGVRQRLWRLTDTAAQAQVIAQLADKKIYIADGHHRYETMLALAAELRQESNNPRSSIEYGTIFLANMDDPSLLVFPTHRVVHAMPSFDIIDVLARAKNFFSIEEDKAIDAETVRSTLGRKGKSAPTFALLHKNGIAYLSLRADADLGAVKTLAGPAVLRTLDVTLLHALVIEEILGISRDAQEKQTNLRYVKELQKGIDEIQKPDVQAVFLMNPTKVQQVQAVADAGEVMPQKSTFFYPKLASGLVLNPLIPSEEV